MAEKRVLVGMIPEVVVIDAGDQVEWISNAGNLKVEFDAKRYAVLFERISGAPRRPAGQRTHPSRLEPRLLSIPHVTE